MSGYRNLKTRNLKVAATRGQGSRRLQPAPNLWHFFFNSLISIVCLSLFFSCASAGKTRIAIIEGDKEIPRWVKDPKRHPDMQENKGLGVVGQSRGLWTSEKSAVSDAETDAKRTAVKILWDEYIQSKTEAESKSGGKDGGVLKREGTEKMTETRLSEGIIRGKRMDYVSQRIEETDSDGSIKTGWRAWVLFVLPKQLLDEIGYTPE